MSESGSGISAVRKGEARPAADNGPTETTARPPSRALRFLRAYWVMFVVLISYTVARYMWRFRSRAAVERMMKKKHKRNAARIRRAIMKLQGLFIKVGQLISILTNFLPEEFRSELEGLQDRVPPHPLEDIQQRIREEFGKNPEKLFARFDNRAVAAASIGQVHMAELDDGTKVAVKVQYPEIERTVRSDLRTLRRIFNLLDRFLPHYGIPQVYTEIRSMVLAELDFSEEARNLAAVAANFDERPAVRFPKVIPEYSTAKVLTTTFEEGIKVMDLAALDRAKVPRTELAKLIIHAYCQQIFTDGIYHADPHPGNILIRPSEADNQLQIVLLDFGAVARISPAMRNGIAEFVQGGIAHDTDKVVRAMKSMGFISKTANPEVYHRVIEYFHARFHEEIKVESLSLKDIRIDPEKGLENLADLRRMNISLRDITTQFHVPKEWILLERTILLLMGLCTKLDAELNPMTVIRPYLEEFVLGDKDLSGFVMDALKEVALSTVALPGEVRRMMNLLQQGHLQVSFANLEDNVSVLYAMGRSFLLAALGVAAAGFAVAFHDRGFHEASLWTGIGSGVLFLGTGLSMLAGRARLRRTRRD